MRPTPLKPYFDDDFVEAVRSKLLFNYKQDNLNYDKHDLTNLKTSGWFIRRFLAWKPTTIDQAVKIVNDVLLWRSQVGINHWTESDFPIEFYKAAACFVYLPDKHGSNVLIIRLKMNKKESLLRPHFEDLAKKYFTFLCEKIVCNHHNRGFGIIFDCQSASLSNVDLENCRLLISTLSNYYAGAVSFVCIYELPWIFNQLWKLVRTWIDSDAKKIIKFSSQKEIQQYIPATNLPDYMGGCGLKDYRFVPKEACYTVEDMAIRFGYSHSDVKKIVEHFKKVINDS